MKRSNILLVLLGMLLVCLAVPALAQVFPPDSQPRIGGSCVWANGKVYQFGGRTANIGPDAAGKVYSCDSGLAAISIYDSATSTWTSSKYNKTGPAGMDIDGNAKCDISDAGVWYQTNHGVAYDDDSDGVKEIFGFVGYNQNNGQVYRYDPNAGTRGTWSKKTENTAWAGFRRGAVAINGSKVYLASGGGQTAKFGWYDIATNTWSSGPNGPDSQQCGAAIVNNKLYVIGGLANSGLNIYECDLTPATPVWTNGGTTIGAVATLQTGVAFPGVVVYNNKIYIIGGRKADGTPTNAIQKFDPVTKVVTTVATLPQARWALNVAIDPATGMLYCGGGGDSASTGDAYRPDTIFNNWWKADLTGSSISFQNITSDPAFFPYEDWVAGGSIFGKVLDPGGNPVPGAIVGVKKSPGATADASGYAVTDVNGNFGPIGAVTGTTYYIATWKPGWTPSADTTIVVNDGANPINIHLTQLIGKNYAENQWVYASTSENLDRNPPSTVVDGDYTSPLAGWEAKWNSTPTQDFIIDISNNGLARSINASTIYWFGDRRAAAYQIDVMSAADPKVLTNWDNPSNYTTVYSTSGTNGGWLNPSDMCFEDPVRFPSTVQARGVRFHMTSYGGPATYGFMEIRLHSSTEFDSLAYGWVRNSAGNGIYNAAVQFGGASGPTAVTDTNGYYSLPLDPGTFEIFADAPGYTPDLGSGVSAGGGFPLVKNFQLTANPQELAIYNGSFETKSNNDDTKADGWIVVPQAPQVDGSFVGSRSTKYNTTPGGSASGWIHTGTPANPPINGNVYFLGGFIESKKIPVNPNNRYSFYFKWRSGEHMNMMSWNLTWLRANGTTIEGQNLDKFSNDSQPTQWEQVVTGGFQNDSWNHKPMIRMAPPADAAYAKVQLGLQDWPQTDAGRSDEGYFDDVVFDEVSRPVVSGKVTDELGNPVAGAVVGIKTTTNAAADAANYAVTDINGNYAVSTDPGTWYLAAWRPEYAPSADVQVSGMFGQMTADIQLTTKSKKNLATKTSPVYASAGADSAPKVVDGDVWANWDSGTAPTATIAVDLGSTKTVSGVVIHWEYARASDYTVEVTTGDPASTGSTWTPVYTSTNGSGGWFTNYWRYMDPIRFPANTQARGVRINATKHVGAYDNYNIWEFQILGTADAGYSKKIGDVKTLPVGTVVKLDKPVTVSGANGSKYGPAGTTFWVEEIDRSTGIKVVVPTDDTGAILAGMGWSGEVADLTGTVAKDAATGEIYIAATDVQTWEWAGKEFQPVGMNARALTTDMPTGLYVKTWGTVKSVDTANYSFTIADGSTKDGAPVEITVVRGANMTAALPAEGQWITVKGVLTGGGKIYEWPVDGFIRGWLMNGAYTVANPGGDEMSWQYANLTNDFFADAGTELAIEPKLGDTAPNGGKWFAASIDAFSSAFNFTQVAFEPVSGQPCVYASVWVKPATDLGETEGLQAWVGSADGYALIITNSIYASGEFGPFVYIKDNVKKDGVTPDADAISYDSSLQSIALKGGEWNHVMIKVNQVDAGFGVAARFMVTDPNDSSKMIPAPMEVSLQKP